MPVKKLNFSLAPINDSPPVVNGATLDNGFSHKNGFPTIKFTIPAQDLLLDTKSLHLSGQFIIKNTDNSLLTFDEVGGNRGNYNLNNGANILRNATVNTSNFNGVSSCIDKVVIQSKKSQQEISHIVNYGQFAGLKMGYMNNSDDYKQVPYIRHLAVGEDHDVACRHIVNSMVVANTHTANIGDRMNGQFFSIELDIPLLKNQVLHLGNSQIGGLMITIHLNPDSNVFHSRHRSISVANQANADPTGTSYMLKNVKLEGKLLVPTPQDLKVYNPQLVMNSQTNLMNDLQSSENANTYTPQLQMVSGMVNTFLDDDQQNNYLYNSNNYRFPVGLVQYLQARNSIRFPFDYETKIKPNHHDSQTEGPNQNTAFAANTVAMPIMAMGDSEARLQFQKAVLGGILSSHNSSTLELTNKNVVEDYNTAAAGANGVGLQTVPDLLGIGCDYTNAISQIQNYVNNDYELKVSSGVQTNRGTLPASRRNKVEIQETYVKNMVQFNTQTLQKVI